MATTQDIYDTPLGARWFKADLHVHTPVSSDMAAKWKDATPDELVEFALAKGVQILGVTDHNSAAWCDKVQNAAKDTGLTVFPGVEISTQQGHLLALFDPGTPSGEIEQLLVRLGIDQSEFGNLDVAAPKGIVDASQEIDKAGGVAIAAHVERERGFLKAITVGAERQRALAAPHLWALEIVDPKLRETYQTGRDAVGGRGIACVQSSDCYPPGADQHQLDGIGYRYTMMKMGSPTLSGLKLALLDPQMRVRLAHDDSPSRPNSIIGMWITGGFLDGQIFRFNENVTCLIGDTGTGKSLALELLRFGLAQQTAVGKIKQEVDALLQDQLGLMGTVHVLLTKDGMDYLVERTWGVPLEAPLVQRVEGASSSSFDGDIDMKLFFPIKAFSQSEIIEFAREPAVRLSLTDDLIDLSEETSSIGDLKDSLRTNAAAIVSEQNRAAQLEIQLAELPGLLETLHQIDKVLSDPRIAQHHGWYEEQTKLKQLAQTIQAVRDRLDPPTNTTELDWGFSPDVKDTPNLEAMQSIADLSNEWTAYISTAFDGLQQKLGQLSARLDAIRSQWKAKFDVAEEAYKQLLNTIDKDGAGLAVLSERRQKTQERISTLESCRTDLSTKVRPKLTELEKKRDGLLTELQKARRSITSRREAKAKELTKKLDAVIRLDVHPRSSKGDCRVALQQICQGSYLSSADVSRLSECHPVPLVKRLMAQEFALLATEIKIEQAKLEKLWGTVVDRKRIEDLFELQLVDVDDVIEVMLKRENGEYRSLERLAHGEKCMVVLMVALAEGDFPLMVDQPEDALHAPGIETGIVKTLRTRRGARQCLFATRNANILVSADAEQIVALQADATHGHIAQTGSLDDYDQRQLVIHHVEGGKDAFRRKQEIYTLRRLRD